MCEERGFRAPPKRAPEVGVSCGYQRGHQRWAWNSNTAAAATKNPVCKHQSLSTGPWEPVQPATARVPWSRDKFPRENTRCASGCCNNTPACSAAGSPCIPIVTIVPLPPPGLNEQEPPNQPLLYPCPIWAGTDAWGQPTHRGGAKNKAEPQELCEQRRGREISPCSLRSSRLNPHNQLDVPCICGIPE